MGSSYFTSYIFPCIKFPTRSEAPENRTAQHIYCVCWISSGNVKVDKFPGIPVFEIHEWRHMRAPLGGGWLRVEKWSLLAPSEG